MFQPAEERCWSFWQEINCLDWSLWIEAFIILELRRRGKGSGKHLFSRLGNQVRLESDRQKPRVSGEAVFSPRQRRGEKADGGGAMLEFLAGEKLPGLEALNF